MGNKSTGISFFEKCFAWSGTMLIILFFSVSHADFLFLEKIEKEVPPPVFVYGANYAGRIFAGGMDNFGGANARYRINRNFAIGAKGEVDISRAGFLAGSFLHYLPSGNLHKELAENYLHFGVDYIKINSEQSPLFSIGYGRDMLPWKKSPFGFRVLCRIEYAPASHVFSRKDKGIFGLDMVKLANTDFAIEAGVFMYK
jgi:hypothetical protein